MIGRNRQGNQHDALYKRMSSGVLEARVKGALRKKVIYGRQSTELGEIKEQNNKKVKREKRYCAATLSDLYPSTCLTWEAVPTV